MTYSVLKVPLNPNQPTNQPTRSVTLVSPTKTDEPIDMLFGLRAPVGQGTTY